MLGRLRTTTVFALFTSGVHLIYHADSIELRIELPDYELKMAAPQLSRWDIIPNDALLDYVHPHLSVTTNQGKPLTLNVLPITSRMDEDGNRDRIYQLCFSADTTPTDWPLTLNYDGIKQGDEPQNLRMVNAGF